MKKFLYIISFATLAACVSDEQNFSETTSARTNAMSSADASSTATATAGTAGARIPLSDFKVYKKAFQDQYPHENGGLYFSKSTFERLLSVKNSEYVFVHYGIEDGELHAMFAPAEESRKHILSALGESTIEDRGTACKKCIPSLESLENESDTTPGESPTAGSGHKISFEDFMKYKADFKTQYPELNESVSFSKTTFERLLNVKKVHYIYVHFAIEAGKLQVVLVPVDSKGTALLKDSDGNSLIENRAGTCPPACPTIF